MTTKLAFKVLHNDHFYRTTLESTPTSLTEIVEAARRLLLAQAVVNANDALDATTLMFRGADGTFRPLFDDAMIGEALLFDAASDVGERKLTVSIATAKKPTTTTSTTTSSTSSTTTTPVATTTTAMPAIRSSCQRATSCFGMVERQQRCCAERRRCVFRALRCLAFFLLLGWAAHALAGSYKAHQQSHNELITLRQNVAELRQQLDVMAQHINQQALGLHIHANDQTLHHVHHAHHHHDHHHHEQQQQQQSDADECDDGDAVVPGDLFGTVSVNDAIHGVKSFVEHWGRLVGREVQQHWNTHKARRQAQRADEERARQEREQVERQRQLEAERLQREQQQQQQLEQQRVAAQKRAAAERQRELEQREQQQQQQQHEANEREELHRRRAEFVRQQRAKLVEREQLERAAREQAELHQRRVEELQRQARKQHRSGHRQEL